jgi:hypothetical protein
MSLQTNELIFSPELHMLNSANVINTTTFTQNIKQTPQRTGTVNV